MQSASAFPRDHLPPIRIIQMPSKTLKVHYAGRPDLRRQMRKFISQIEKLGSRPLDVGTAPRPVSSRKKSLISRRHRHLRRRVRRPRAPPVIVSAPWQLYARLNVPLGRNATRGEKWATIAYSAGVAGITADSRAAAVFQRLWKDSPPGRAGFISYRCK